MVIIRKIVIFLNFSLCFGLQQSWMLAIMIRSYFWYGVVILIAKKIWQPLGSIVLLGSSQSD